MKGDNSTWLERAVHRPRSVSSTQTLAVAICDSCLISVRISSWAQYNTGLFILNLDKVPWGCGKLLLYFLEPQIPDLVIQPPGPRIGMCIYAATH